jgi:hypothetical protein
MMTNVQLLHFDSLRTEKIISCVHNGQRGGEKEEEKRYNMREKKVERKVEVK